MSALQCLVSGVKMVLLRWSSLVAMPANGVVASPEQVILHPHVVIRYLRVSVLGR